MKNYIVYFITCSIFNSNTKSLYDVLNCVVKINKTILERYKNALKIKNIVKRQIKVSLLKYRSYTYTKQTKVKTHHYTLLFKCAVAWWFIIVI